MRKKALSGRWKKQNAGPLRLGSQLSKERSFHGIGHPNLHGTGPKGDLVIFINPVFSGFDFVCYGDDIIGVFVRSETPRPSNAWYALAARAGAAVANSNRIQEMETVIRECHKEARAGGVPIMRVEGTKVQCHVIAGDDGDAGAEIIWIPPRGIVKRHSRWSASRAVVSPIGGKSYRGRKRYRLPR